LDRMVLRDDQWERIAPLIPGKVEDPGRSGADNRLFVEAVPLDYSSWSALARPSQAFREMELRIPEIFSRWLDNQDRRAG
jgi:hypothetical protein